MVCYSTFQRTSTLFSILFACLGGMRLCSSESYFELLIAQEINFRAPATAIALPSIVLALTEKPFNGDGHSDVDGSIESNAAQRVEDGEEGVDEMLTLQVELMGTDGVHQKGAAYRNQKKNKEKKDSG